MVNLLFPGEEEDWKLFAFSFLVYVWAFEPFTSPLILLLKEWETRQYLLIYLLKSLWAFETVFNFCMKNTNSFKNP
jgi:hypothetical protein